MNETCPSCGTAYEEHLGLVGTCRELQEALEAFSIVSRTSNEYLCQLTAAEMSVKDYRAKNTMLREALEAITYANNGCQVHNGNDIDSCNDMHRIAVKALQQAGGGE